MNGQPNESCTAFAALLPRLPDADLDPETAARVAAHLDECADCRTEADAFHGLATVLRQATPTTTLPSGAQVVRYILEAEREGARPLPRLGRLIGSVPAWGWAGTAAAALVLASGLSRGPAPAPPQPAAPIPAETVQFLVITDDERTGRRVVQAPHLESTPHDSPGSLQ